MTDLEVTIQSKSFAHKIRVIGAISLKVSAYGSCLRTEIKLRTLIFETAALAPSLLPRT